MPTNPYGSKTVAGTSPGGATGKVITNGLSRNCLQFVSRLAADTGLNVGVCATWLALEEPVDADFPSGHQDQNWLNIGNTDSHWYAGAWTGKSAIECADLSAQWLKGTYSVPGFGKPIQAIQNILHYVNRSPEEQLAAISGSGWALGGYPNWPSVYATYKDTTPDPTGAGATGAPSSTSAAGSGGAATSTPGNISASAAAFSTYMALPGIFDSALSRALTGEKSLMNDTALFPFIEQLSTASLRSFMSMPNGNFYAFYPDYFGGLGRTPYWEIDDVEIIDGNIQLSDDALATHVYVVGDISGMDQQITFEDRVQSGGVVTVFNAFMADFLNGLPDPETSRDRRKKRRGSKSKSGSRATSADPPKSNPSRPSLANRQDALAFLQKYGARPWYEEAPMVRSPIFEAFLAYQRFCILWAQQFRTTFEFTFMPELYPGGLVAFPEHGLQCYVEEVEHDCSYQDGFTTTATLSAPAALRTQSVTQPDGTVVKGTPIDLTRAWVHSGMIRAFSFDPDDIGSVSTGKN